jgi:N-acyl-D-aspartate/D-glutamate deacylase
MAFVLVPSLIHPLTRTVLTSAYARTPSIQTQQLDLLILHGTLVDGSGGKPRKADVGIRGDRIVFVGDARNSRLEAARTIDATGLVVAPGFIDPHTHTLADLTGEKTKSNQAFLLQGVTTVITGQ